LVFAPSEKPAPEEKKSAKPSFADLAKKLA
jgi:hypothetical protein